MREEWGHKDGGGQRERRRTGEGKGCRRLGN